MIPMPKTLALLALTAALGPAAAHAQQASAPAYPGTFYNLSPDLTEDGFADMTRDLGSLLRFRQLGDSRALGRGTVDLGVQFGSAPIDGWTGVRVGGRVGFNRRTDIGAWGGVNFDQNYGMVGVDFRFVLLEEGVRFPVTLAVRPSATTLLGPADIWAGTTGIDITVSRTFGAFSPYAGLAATNSIAFEQSPVIELDHASVGESLAYAGLAFRWQTLVVSAEVERGATTDYAVRVGTRF